MYNIGEKLLYSSHGVYEVVDIRYESMLGERKKYYVLRELGDSESSLVFIPLGSDAEANLLHPLISEDSARKLLNSYADITPMEWVDNPRVRAVMHKRVLDSADRESLLALIKLINTKQKERLDNGKKPFLTDEHTLERALRLLSGEIACVLGMNVSDVMESFGGNNRYR